MNWTKNELIATFALLTANALGRFARVARGESWKIE